MSAEFVALGVRFDPAPGMEAEELERLMLGLRGELLELDVGSVEFGRGGPVPDGARGAGEVMDVGMLVINVAKSGAAAFSVVMAVRSWLNRNRRSRLRLSVNGHELEVEGLSSADRDRVISDWLAAAGQVES
jgi:Effector Associated Constant Component 1